MERRYFLMLLCLLASSMANVSCDDDDDLGGGASWLVGTWTTTMYMVDDDDDDGDNNTFTLYGDGTCMWEETSGSWSYKGGKLTMTYRSGDELDRFTMKIGKKSGSSFSYTCDWYYEGSPYDDGETDSYTDSYRGVMYKD